jgi:hypothetical protein
MIELSDGDIRARLTDTEDGTVERKTASDYRDCLKTAVAFSNSLPVDDPGVIFVGVYDNGQVQNGQNLEALQKNVSKELSKIYPRIFPQMKVLKDDNGQEFLAVIVRGSENRPHFAGQSYIRDGTQTIPASEEQFTQLIAERSSKARQILKWRGKLITVWAPNAEKQRHPSTGSRAALVLADCNEILCDISIGRSGDTTGFSALRPRHRF